jgi:arylsulfatase A-like enzyme
VSRLTAWVAAAALLGCLGLATTGVEVGRPDDRANVVVIMTDDMRLDELPYMPHVQRLLVDRGVTFEQGLSPYPLCCPARSSVLTGQYSHNHGVQGNKWPRGGFPRLDDDETLPVWLGREDYTTALVGKYLNGYPESDSEYVPPGWDHWEVAVSGIYNFLAMTSNVNGELVSHGGEYSTLVIDASSARFADIQSGSSRPFFLWSSYIAPHTECLIHRVDGCWGPPRPAPVDAGRYAGIPLPNSPAINEQDISDKGGTIRGLPRMSDDDLAAAAFARQQRIESLQSVDRGVAHLVETLEQAGELDETYVLFVSDNGLALGEHRLLSRKVLGYEELVRVPFVLTGPGIPAGRTVHQAVTMADITATVTDIAGLEPAHPLDGESVLPVARGEVPDNRDRVVPLEAGPLRGRGDGWLYQGVRTDRYTLIRWQGGFVELYDRLRDPAQVTSVAGDPAYADVLRYLEDATDSLHTCAGQECVRWYEGPDVATQ